MKIPTLLRFTYTNWKRETHQYLVAPKELVFDDYGFDRPGWLLKAEVITRDGQPRRNLRHFLLTKITSATEVLEVPDNEAG
jgi:hypothetical protein